jgi:small subunit ribosomal protein S16
MTKIRLARFGSRHQPHYRVVVTDSRSRRDGRFIEILGSYDPRVGTLQVNKERAEYWIGVGAQPTNTTISLLTKAGVTHSFVVAKKPFQKKDEPVTEEALAEAAATETAEDEAVIEESAAEGDSAASEEAAS